MKEFLLHITTKIKLRAPGGIPVCLIMGLLLLTTGANAQIIAPLDGVATFSEQSGPTNRVRTTCTNADGADVFVAYQTAVEKYTSETFKSYISIDVWNGYSWNRYGKVELITADHESVISEMIFYKNELYLAGNFTSANELENTAYLVKFNGTDWESVGGFVIKKKGVVKALEVYDNKLIAAGHFEQIDGVFATNIAQYDGSEWDFMGSSGIKQGVDVNNMVYDLLSANNLLYVGGDFGSAASDPEINVLATWDGNAWTNIKALLDECHVLGEHNNQVYLYGNVSLKPVIYRQQGTSWLDLTSPSFRVKSAITSFASYNGKLWVSGSFIEPNFDTDLRSLLSFDDNGWVVHKTSNLGVETPALTYPELVVTSRGLFISGPFDENNGVDLKYIGKILIDGKAIIQGVVYEDLESNCKKDNGEPGIAKRYVVAQPGGHLAVTDEKGGYSFEVPPGEYTINLVDKKHWITKCPGENKDIKVTAEADSVHVVSPIPSYGLDYKRDLEVMISGTSGFKMREGYTETYYVCAKNIGTYNLTGAVLNLHVDERLQKVTFVEEPFSFDDYNATYRIDVLEPGQEVCFMFTAVAPIEVINGKTVNFEVSTNPIIKDEDLSNNRYTLSQIVTSAFDPNNKQVKVEGSTDVFENDIFIPAGTEVLRYQINFQNTGNDTAYRVTVIDTLDVTHVSFRTKIEKTDVPNYSMRPTMLPDGRLEIVWTFDGIMLPDSATNPEGSKGHIIFTVPLKEEAVAFPGQEVRNKAYIYFDYQKPVITNNVRAKVLSTPNVDRPLSELVLVYPNPAGNSVVLQNKTTETQILTITDVTGKVLDTVELKANETLTLNTSNYANGIYFVHTEGSAAYKLIISH